MVCSSELGRMVGLGGSGRDAGLAEVRAEGVAEGVQVNRLVAVVVLRNARGREVAVEDLDGILRHVQQRRPGATG